VITAQCRNAAQLWIRLQVLGDVLNKVLDRRDIILFLVKRGLVALVENGEFFALSRADSRDHVGVLPIPIKC
jgi:hypothetical protein